MSDTQLTSEAFAVLHVARIKGIASEELLGRSASAQAIEQLVDQELIKRTKRGCALTLTGLELHGKLLAEEQAAADLGAIAASYDRFLAVNAQVKGACASWQSSDGDAEALWHATDLLGQHLGRVRPALRKAGGVLPRFEVYLARLTDANQLAMDGDARFITDPTIDSFHNVWFECHEDYLVTLGRSREDEEQ
jgi:hypothetical protein